MTRGGQEERGSGQTEREPGVKEKLKNDGVNLF